MRFLKRRTLNRVLIFPIIGCAFTTLQLPANEIEVSEVNIIYQYEEMFQFDIAAYLQQHSPHLYPYAEIISHWSGYSSISPKVLLTLMEMQSGVVQQPTEIDPKAFQPFGILSNVMGVSAQTKQVAIKLSKIYYDKLHAEYAVHASQSPQSETLAEAALKALFVRLPQNTDHFARFRETYALLFPVAQYPVFEETQKSIAAYHHQNVPQKNMLQLPFPIKESWWFGGSHTNTGSGDYPQSSLDMNNGGRWGSDTSNKWVVSSANGKAKRHSSCFVEVVHESGWSTTYYHLGNVQISTNDPVTMNQRLANYANSKSQALCNGGHSTGPHQHYSVKKDGRFYHLNGVYLSGYKVKTGRDSYDRNCNYFWLEKDGKKYCTSQKLYNPGVADQPEPPVTELKNQEPVEGLASTKGKEKHYFIQIPEGARDLKLEIDGGKGDADMHVLFGKRASLGEYDCRPYKVIQRETCVFADPKKGKYYAMLHAFSDYQDITLSGSYLTGKDDSTALENRKTIEDTQSQKGAMAYFHIEIPEEASNLRFEQRGGTGDSDMHVRFGQQPTLDRWDCRPFRTKPDETCVFDQPKVGVYHVLLHAFKPYDGVALTASFEVDGRTVTKTVHK
ncbi:pre-peptidase C-terminal domain-containing protein [Algicola sagamiensis]|uniref:pre-peptidase C-terminal domain-containing protein n=1 Tax=Algicola sagamiensis TaxID=163869 RepID=UPI000369AB5C|nr:pre-peptidase C-terminal domain-containing protein [Algicola sagamiensis]